MSWLDPRYSYPFGPREALEINDHIRAGERVWIRVADQREMCHAKRLLQQANVIFTRKGKPHLGSLSFENEQLL